MIKNKKRLLLLLIPFIIIYLILVYTLSGPSVKKTKERFVVNQGTSEETIVSKLFENGYLRNKQVFELILTLNGWHGKIQPGGYLISDEMNVYDLAKNLIFNPAQKWVFIPPGKRKEQTAIIVKKAINWPNEETLKFINQAQEGYLFPDTYLIDIDSKAEQVIQKLTNNFNDKYYKKLQLDLFNENIRNDTAIKIASIIERETGGENDKRIISAIIWNRINKGMRLEIDSTIQYPVATEACKLDSLNPELENCNFWPPMTSNIIQNTPSPYNTYKNDGLPPAPICSPSLSSIEAVAYPAQTDALYYLHSPDKQIHTAKTYEEHLKNIETYLH